MDPFFAGDTNVLKTYKFKYDEIVDFEREIAFQEIIKNAVSPLLSLSSRASSGAWASTSATRKRTSTSTRGRSTWPSRATASGTSSTST